MLHVLFSGFLYRLPKIHKFVIPLRHFLAEYSLPSFKLTKYLVTLLIRFATKQYSIQNNFSLINKLKQLYLDTNKFFASFGIIFLFKNVSVKVIDII